MRSSTGPGERGIYSEDYKKLAQKLRRARIETGLTQEQAAKRLNRNQSFISKLERAQYYLDIFDLRAIAKVYGKPIEYFLSR
jgi:transcriptional regulator with XRE-family HTH domain